MINQQHDVQVFIADNSVELIKAVQASHLLVASLGYLFAIGDLLGRGAGSRGSYLVLANDGECIHKRLCRDNDSLPMRYVAENETFRGMVQKVWCPDGEVVNFKSEMIRVRNIKLVNKPFESAWREYREDLIYSNSL